MKTLSSRLIHLCTALATFGIISGTIPAFIPVTTAQAQTARLSLPADSNWKFFLGDPNGAEAISFADSSWRTVNLPHDWSIESAPDKDNPSGPGGGFFPAGIGWYRKTFNVAPDWKGKRVSVEFDGVYRDATIYLNGHKLGTHPYGYTSFSFDLTSKSQLLRPERPRRPRRQLRAAQQPLVQRLRHLPPCAPRRYWSRPCRPLGSLRHHPRSHGGSATVSVSTQRRKRLRRTSRSHTSRRPSHRPGGSPAREQTQLQINANTSKRNHANDHPCQTQSSGRPHHPPSTVPSQKSSRQAKSQTVSKPPSACAHSSWSVDKGLLLNGQSIKLVGGSVHHDNGPLGAAAFDRAEDRRVEILKAAGFNAVRTAHNPPSPAFLDACDRLGILVLDEPFDVWKAHKPNSITARFFNDWWKQDVDSMIMRDRNHPAIVAWGIGNEIPEG